jgi:hypothetical protein
MYVKFMNFLNFSRFSRLLSKLWPSLYVLHLVVNICSKLSEALTASTFMEAEFVQLDAEMTL